MEACQCFQCQQRGRSSKTRKELHETYIEKVQNIIVNAMITIAAKLCPHLQKDAMKAYQIRSILKAISLLLTVLGKSCQLGQNDHRYSKVLFSWFLGNSHHLRDNW
eukprot:5611731-Amphidinium_carterae.1